ncbi:MAG: methyltransferase domain-containing protein [Bacteroidia bacterium]|nr:methyltransferase domain-containing protein [Bacteroidia bacterium]
MQEFIFQQFGINHSRSSMKVGTDAVLLGAFADTSGASQILEIGTGCGIISLMLAQRSNAQITAIDIHYESFAEASENFAASKWSKRLKAVHGDIRDLAGSYNLIVSNPPYFARSLKSQNEKRNFARHNDNLTPKILADVVQRLLLPQGIFVCVIPHDQCNDFRTLFMQKELYLREMITIRPKAGKEPNRSVLTIGFDKPDRICHREFIIRNNESQYTEEYKSLTAGFHPDCVK